MIRQSSGYVSAAVLASVAGAVITVLVARALSVGDFAVYSFANVFFGFAAMFFEFGLLAPASRRLSLADEQDRKRVLGAATLVLVGLAVTFSVTVYGLSLIVDSFFSVNAGGALRMTAAVSGGWALTQGCLMLAQGTGKIGAYSTANAASKVLYLAVLGGMMIAGWQLSASGALVIESVTLGLAFALMLVSLRPTLRGTKRELKAFLLEAREYGFAIYVGRVFSVGTYNMDVLMLAWFKAPTEVAFYSLAGSIAAMVALAPVGVTTALFRNMARLDRLPRKWIQLVAAVSLAGATGATILAIPFVTVLLGARYTSVLVLVPVMAVAQSIGGFTRLFNSFLWAQRRGRDLRTAAVVMTIMNLLLNFALIPTFGAVGAAWASVIALCSNLAAHIFGYRRAVARPTSRESSR